MGCEMTEKEMNEPYLPRYRMSRGSSSNIVHVYEALENGPTAHAVGGLETFPPWARDR